MKNETIEGKTDYKKIGLKCGIEIHQQLEGKKLFCRCPTKIIDEKETKHDLQVKRHLRAVVGETGEIDVAAAHEQAKNKEFIYNYYKESCCLVDLDEEPPHPINKESVRTSFIVSRLLNAKPVDEIQVMRKTVVDGSNTTGFQRTALVAMDGWINTSEGKITIPTICLEEDSAKIISREEDHDIYNLSRLGIPLVEIATGPDIKTPEGVKETAEKIGSILRSTGDCKRGLGTIRQDVNVSIKGGTRVEIKGAQDLKILPELVKNEIKRQQGLIELKKKIKTKVKEDIIDLTKIFSGSESKVIKSALKKKGTVLGIKMPGYKGLIGLELQNNKRLGTEFSDYAKVKAGVGGIFHSDEMPNYGITENDVKSVAKALKCSEKDGFILVADLPEKSRTALLEVIMRANLIEKGVISEVRKANADGTTSYMRPMPGGARMYPETDILPLKMNFGNVQLPRLIDDKALDYEKLGLSKDLALAIAKSEMNPLFEELCQMKNVKPGFAAETLISYQREIKKIIRNPRIGLITEEVFREIFRALDKNNISKNSVMQILTEVSDGKELDISRYKTASKTDIEDAIRKIVRENKDAPFGALMGMAMQKLGNVDGRTVYEILKKIMK